ncbi:MATE family efflux transporter [soil metagenome]
MSAAASFVASGRRIYALAWPVLVGQLAVMAYGLMDTVMTARYSADDLAALALGNAIYISLFVAGMGVIMSLGPIVGQLYGARRSLEIGSEIKQGIWLALMMSVLGGLLLAFPHPILRLTGADPEIEHKAVLFLRALAFGLPAALGFQVFRALSNAISRPKFVMAIQVAGLVLKIPLSAVLIHGFTLGPVSVPAQGGPGCGIATTVVLWCMFATTIVVQRRDPAFATLGIWAGGLGRPRWAAQRQLLRLGLPMGGSYLIEVTGFVFMALFIIRFGSATLAGHQIVTNIVSILFMLPLSIAIATSTLVAQSLGAREPERARRLGWHGLLLATLVSFVTSSTVWLARDHVVAGYTDNPAIAAAALPLLGWVVGFHVFDAFQTVSAFVVRAYKVAVAPMVIYVIAMWCMGLGGGWLVGFDVTGRSPDALRGASGFWFAATFGLALAGILMGLLMRRTTRRVPLVRAG